MSIYDLQRGAVEQVATLIALPVVDEFGEWHGCDDQFDPWRLFPSLYGSYSSAFDDMALEVLERLAEPTYDSETLAHEMFREMLCTADLCDYGSSPRVCFPTSEFRELLPALIAKWREYYAVKWPAQVDQSPSGSRPERA